MDPLEKLPAPRTPTPVPDPGLGAAGRVADVAHARELFWQNVMQEILTSLATISSSQAKSPVVDAAGLPMAGDLFDGRLAIITSLGQRIPIASVYPLFACGIGTSDANKALSMAVECTVFQIHSPGGEVYTLPLHEIRCFHALSEQLIDQIKQATRTIGGDPTEPFGFAAYTSLARTNLPSEVAPLQEPSQNSHES